MPKEHYIVKVGNHNEEILGEDILAILEAAFDDALENQISILDKLEEIEDDF